MICYIDKNSGKRTNELAGLLRAQLSNHEQALLCLNSLSIVGAAWRKNGFMEKFSMIKNIPESFFDPNTELDVKQFYPNIVFEYERHLGDDAEPNRDII
jgi:hypothetical protein